MAHHPSTRLARDCSTLTWDGVHAHGVQCQVLHKRCCIEHKQYAASIANVQTNYSKSQKVISLLNRA